MCISPIRIRNPNLGRKNLGFLYDTESAFINIPCGVCKQCIAMKQMSLVQRVQMESLNSFMYFSTLTYDNAHLPHITTSSGYDISYVEVRHLQNLFKRLRNYNMFGRPFRYFAVSERGGEKGRPHVHILWFIPKYDNEDYIDGLSLEPKIYHTLFENWKVNVGSKRCPKYESLFEYHERYYRGKLYKNFDTHFVVPKFSSDGISSLAFYVCKYLLKPSYKEKRLQQALHLNLDSDEYETIWNLVKSRSFRSEHFGLALTDTMQSLSVVNYLRDCVRKSDRSLGYPQFFLPDKAQSFPLAHYYKSIPYIYDFKTHLDFIMDKSPFVYKDLSFTECINAEHYMDRVQSQVDSKDMSIDFNFLFDD